MLEGVKKDTKRRKEEKVESRKRIEEINEALEEMKVNLAKIEELKPELSSLRERLVVGQKESRRLRRSNSEVVFKGGGLSKEEVITLKLFRNRRRCGLR